MSSVRVDTGQGPGHTPGMPKRPRRREQPQAIAYFVHTPERPSTALEDAIGSRFRELRQERGWTQDDAATIARAHGLDDWDRAVIANLERWDNRRPMSTRELAAVLRMFRCGIGDLLGPDSVIELAGMTTTGAGVAQIFAGDPSTFPTEKQDAETLAAWQAADARPTLAETRAARSLGLRPDDVLVVRESSLAVWGRTLGAERNARLAERTSGDPDPKGARRAVLGHITRELIAELGAHDAIKRARRRASRKRS